MLAQINWRSPRWRIEHLPTMRSRVSQPPNWEQADARRVHELPCLASDFFADVEELYGWTPTLKTIFEGTKDKNCPLSKLEGMEKDIYDFAALQWASHVTLTIPAACVGRMPVNSREGTIRRFPSGRRREDGRPAGCEDVPELQTTSRHVPTSHSQRQLHQQGYVAFSSCGTVTFPEPADRNVNMLPFIFGDKSSLPPELRCYYDLIEKCPYKYTGNETGKVGYLTVHEGFVQAGDAQRREGLHIETPSVVDDGTAAFTPALEHCWGIGVFFEPDRYEGGIYMASNVANTSEVYDALVDKNIPGIVDKHGGCEHLRPLLGPSTKLAANQLIWMTDCTPHEALPQAASEYRQFFRVVTSQISHWFAQHSTPNPYVAIPENVVVVKANKFD